LIFGFLSFNLQAQQDWYVGGSLDAGVMGKTNFEQSSLSKKNYSPHYGGLLFVNYRFLDLFSLELGLGQHWNNTRLKDPDFEKQYDGFSVEMNNKHYYWNYYVALSGHYRFGKTETYLYGKLAYSFNNYGKESISKERGFAISRLDVDQSYRSTTNYVASNHSLIPEVGLEQKLGNGSLLGVGLKMNIAQEDALSGSYVVRDNVSGVSEVDRFSSPANFTSLTFSYKLLLHHVPKRENRKKAILEENVIPIDVSTKPVVKAPEEKDTLEEIPTEIADRKIIVKKKMEVSASRVTVMIWDHQSVDGDRVSLNLNGKWIVKNRTLKKEKYTFEIDLLEGSNIFVLHALNLGKHPPNTAALLVDDGEKTHRIILRSTLNESGTLEINYKKKEQ
jgi:hypothetical protein